MTGTEDWMRASHAPPVELHTDRAHAARVYDVLLGGKTNYPADRKAAEQLLRALPSAHVIAEQNRAFMHRAVRHLATESGVRQFLDIGTGIPTSPNLHEVAQEAAPESRVVYADNDPIVLVHSRALHTSRPEGRTAYIEGDVREPEAILDNAELRATLDLDRPVALTMFALLHWLPLRPDPYEIVARLMRELPRGSFLALSHATNDFEPEAMEQVSEDFKSAGSTVITRGKEEITRFFDGMELLEPGVEVLHRWRPEETDLRARRLGDRDIAVYAGVARKT